MNIIIVFVCLISGFGRKCGHFAQRIIESVYIWKMYIFKRIMIFWQLKF